jgi:CBS-domain-containing membrane protein
MSLGDALERMYMDNIRHLPVVDEGGRLVGLLSTRDVSIAALRGLELHDTRVDAVMTPAPYSCPTDSSLIAVVERMERDRIGSAVVVRNGKPCGIFTTIDALRALRSQLLGRKAEPLTSPTIGPDESSAHHRPPTPPHVPGVRAPKPGDSMVSWLLARL